ncbi:MAG: hypothetical protein ABWJ99_07550 [Caldimicrobium sp.]
MAKQGFHHLFLSKGENKEEALKVVITFLEKYQLLRYERYAVDKIIQASEDGFFDELAQALEKNKNILENFISELMKEGFTALSDLLTLPQGYLSKVFHLIAHLLDGFFGIDSFFFNLLEDSHWVSKPLLEKIKKEPDKFYLIKITGFIEKPVSMFEILSPKKFLER